MTLACQVEALPDDIKIEGTLNINRDSFDAGDVDGWAAKIPGKTVVVDLHLGWSDLGEVG